MSTWEKRDDDRWYLGSGKRLCVLTGGPGSEVLIFEAGVQRPNGTWEHSGKYTVSLPWLKQAARCTDDEGDDPFAWPSIHRLLGLVFDACWKLAVR